MKRIAFTAVMLATPVLLLVALEFGLRALNAGGDPGLTVRTTIGGAERTVLNRRLGERYFAGSPVAVPEPMEEFLPAEGDTAIRRILCLGESTMQGFPYEYNATAPGLLEERLTAMFPHERIDVINLGLSAVGSFVIHDILRDAVRLKPDLVIVYAGHNEFYGAYGAASAVGGSSHAALTRLTIRLLRYRTFLLLRDLFLALRPKADGIPRGTLMAQMAGERTIPLEGDLYASARSAWRENLQLMIEEARSAGIPIMFCTVASNLRDQPPFVSLHGAGVDSGRAGHQERLLAEADARSATGDTLGLEDSLRRAAAMDTAYAAARYALGRVLLARGRTAEALVQLRRAKDLDGLRFRATEEFQQILTGVCRENGVPLAPVESVFAASSPDGVVGFNLMLEHLHPTIDGYALMARVIGETMERHGLVFPREAWRAAHRPDEAALAENSSVTQFDRTLGGIKVALLTQRWPFRRGTAEPTFHPADGFEELVYRYVRRTIAWSDARYAAAAWFADQRRFDLARRECRTVARVIPFSYYPVFQEAEYWRAEGRQTEAAAAYRRALAVEENPFSRMKLAVIHLEAGRPREAVPDIETALAGRGTGRLSAAARAGALYLLGGARAQLGELDAAAGHLRDALAIEPGNAETRALLDQVLTAQAQARARRP